MMPHGPDILPRRYPPSPAGDIQIRVARVRLNVARLALDEALAGQRPINAVILALENVGHAVTELRRWIDAEASKE